jgi:hypothetical protein
MEQRGTNSLERVFGVVWPIVLAAFAALLVLEAISLFWIAPSVAREVGAREDVLYLLMPFPTGVATSTGAGNVALFTFFAVAIIASLVWMVRDFRVARASLERSLDDKANVPETSQVGLTCQVFIILVLTSFVWYELLYLGGIEPYVPPFEEMEPWELGYIFAKASVYEELVSRVLFIGVPMAIVALVRERRGWWRLFTGGKGELGMLDWGLVAVSGVVFALAHAPGWDLYKVPPTVVAGLGFGYLFAKKGLAPAIVLHFAIDYLEMPAAAFGADQFNLAVNLVVLGMMAFGIYLSVRFAVAAYNRAIAAPQQPQPVPHRALAPEGRFVCVTCGGLDAKYVDGDLVCLRCGQQYRFL